MSTFTSNSSYFGYNATATANADPATQLSIGLTMYTNTNFSQIGFSVIMICDGFETIVKMTEFVMLLSNITYTNAVDVPTNNDIHSFIESIGIDSHSYDCKYATFTLSSNSTSVSIIWNAPSNTQAVKIKYIKVFVLIFDTALRTSTLRFKYLTWSWAVGTVTSQTAINGHSNRTLYTLPVVPDKRCVITYKTAFWGLCINENPYAIYTLDATTGHIKGENNACNTTIAYNSAFCWTDGFGCAPAYPYKSLLSDQCFNCASGGVIVASKFIIILDQVYNNCAQYDYSQILYNNDTTTGDMIGMCISCSNCCITCATNYYLKTGNCYTCPQLYNNCLLCTTSTCTQCIDTTFYLNGVNCSSCASGFTSACLYCTPAGCT